MRCGIDVPGMAKDMRKLHKKLTLALRHFQEDIARPLAKAQRPDNLAFEARCHASSLKATLDMVGRLRSELRDAMPCS
jgi:hypothetical protein